MHEGHRERMRKRYMTEESFDSFSAFEYLEMLLSYSKPRIDTNPCAHELMERFGSVKGIFEASVDELCGVEGMGQSSAILIKLVTEGMRRYATDASDTVICYDTLSKISDYIYPLFLGLNHERLYMLLFNNRMNLIDCVAVSDGTVNSSNVPTRLMVEKAILKNATSAVLAHNHPNGLAIPSGNDMEVTDAIKTIFDSLDIILLEHIVVAETRFWPIMRQHYSTFRPSPITKRVESRFYERFYDLDESNYCVTPFFEAAKLPK